MDSLNNLRDSLDSSSRQTSGARKDEKYLTDDFKAAALHLTKLYRSSLSASSRSYTRGYIAALADVLEVIEIRRQSQPHASSSSSTGTFAANEVSGPGGWLSDYIRARMEALRSDEEEQEQQGGDGAPSEELSSASRRSANDLAGAAALARRMREESASTSASATPVTTRVSMSMAPSSAAIGAASGSARGGRSGPILDGLPVTPMPASSSAAATRPAASAKPPGTLYALQEAETASSPTSAVAARARASLGGNQGENAPSAGAMIGGGEGAFGRHFGASTAPPSSSPTPAGTHAPDSAMITAAEALKRQIASHSDLPPPSAPFSFTAPLASSSSNPTVVAATAPVNNPFSAPSKADIVLPAQAPTSSTSNVPQTPMRRRPRGSGAGNAVPRTSDVAAGADNERANASGMVMDGLADNDDDEEREDRGRGRRGAAGMPGVGLPKRRRVGAGASAAGAVAEKERDRERGRDRERERGGHR